MSRNSSSITWRAAGPGSPAGTAGRQPRRRDGCGQRMPVPGVAAAGSRDHGGRGRPLMARGHEPRPLGAGGGQRRRRRARAAATPGAPPGARPPRCRGTGCPAASPPSALRQASLTAQRPATWAGKSAHAAPGSAVPFTGPEAALQEAGAVAHQRAARRARPRRCRCRAPHAQ